MKYLQVQWNNSRAHSGEILPMAVASQHVRLPKISSGVMILLFGFGSSFGIRYNVPESRFLLIFMTQRIT